MSVSRRKFLAGSSFGLGLFGISAAQAKEPIPSSWDKTYDVVVVGLGGAGASAAIEAFDNGAKVLVLEKQAKNHLYNNTRMSGGGFHCPDKDGDPKALKEYAKAMFSGENISWKSEGEQPEVSEPFRCRSYFVTDIGSKVLNRSRETSMRTLELSVKTVLLLVPFRLFAASSASGSASAFSRGIISPFFK